MQSMEAERGALAEFTRLLNSATDIAGMGIHVVDLDTRKMYFSNESGFRLIDREPCDYEGKTCYEVFFGIDHPCDNCRLEATKQGISSHETYVPEYDKTFLTHTEITDWHGRKVLIEYITDITSDKKKDAALCQADNASKAKTDFLSRMSHDMRTPMNGIIGLATLLMDEKIPDDIRNGLVQIQAYGKYLINLINDTLDVNKIETNKLELHPVVTDAYRMTANLEANARLMAAGKGIDFEMLLLNPEDLTPTVLFMDEFRTEQIFMNLVANAIKFTPKGGHVWVTIERLETTESHILNRYQIKDTGIGMSQEFLSHIYEPFSQEGRADMRRENGTGLGMTIVRKLVLLMGGKLEVESKLGEGTTFTLTIRFDRYHGKIDTSNEMKKEDVPLGGKRILLCEDHPLNREIAEKLLKKVGILVDTAEDGQAGADKFSASDIGYYDLILMDIRMPVLNGYEATRKIRSMDRMDALDIPIIALTADAFASDVRECMEAGMTAHLSKPIEIDKMYRIIGKYIK